MAVLVQNENMKNQMLNFRGEQYQCDENGVMRCSQLVAEFLLNNNPGNHWKPYRRDLAKDADALKLDVIQCEAELRAAERKLEVARNKLAAFEKESKEVEKLDAVQIAEPPAVVTPEVEAAAEISEEDYPTMAWNKARIVEFAEQHEIEIDPSGTKAELLEAIEAATE